MKAKILEGVATATTLGDALVEFQLLCLVHSQHMPLVSQGVLNCCVVYFSFSPYPMDRHGSPFSNSVKPNNKFSLITMFRNWEGQFGLWVKKFHSISFCFWCFSVAHRLGQYLYRVTQEHMHCSTTSEPGQYPGGVACFTSLQRKPFSSFTFVFFKRIVHRHLFFLGKKKDLDLLRVEQVVPSEKHARSLTQVFSFRFPPSPFLLVG